MPFLEIAKPVATDAPVFVVENVLPPGVHRFELVVENDKGLRSAPARTQVRVVLIPIVVGPHV
jgi:hypothetical protein